MPRLDLLPNLGKSTVPYEKRLNLFVPMELQNQKMFSNISQYFYSYKVDKSKYGRLGQRSAYFLPATDARKKLEEMAKTVDG